MPVTKYNALIAALAVLAAAPIPALAGTPRPPATPADDMVIYPLAAGQNLYGVARRYFTHLSAYREVQHINHVANAHRIAPGTPLSVPVRLLRTEPLDARVLATRGTVTLSGKPARANDPVVPGTVVETGPDGFVSLRLSNGSQVTVPTRSRMRIITMRRILLTDALDFDIAIEAGKVETQATPLPAGRGGFRLRTPRAVSAIRGTTLRVGFDEGAGDSATEVVEGKVAVGAAGAKGEPQMVAQGFGAQVSATGSLAMEQLLPPPDLVEPGKVLVDPLPIFAIAPLAGASGYHVQVAADSSFADLVAEARGTTASVPVPDLPDGRWFVRLTAYSSRGLEGLPQVYSVRRTLTGLKAGADRDADRVRFSWSAEGNGAHTYRFQLARGDASAAPMLDEPALTGDALSLSGLADGVYFWRVGVRQFGPGGLSETWMPFQKFTMAGAK